MADLKGVTGDTPKTVYLKDYLPPAYKVREIDLCFELEDEATVVTSVLVMFSTGMAGSPSVVLDGECLELLSIKLDGSKLEQGQFELNETQLSLPDPGKDEFRLEIITRINPAANTSLEGLYLSSGNFCTQCEAEGFRKITYFPDRPDVMARYTTKLLADRRKYPVLLSNGDCIAAGEQEDGRHWAQFRDPYPKPSYLFALVAGDLSCIEDKFVTMSGKSVDLRIYVESHNKDKCEHAMASLKNAMKWDEDVYGREYDLETYVVVAVDDFNMGAMENKGLNVFNSKYVLARPDTATDKDYQDIEGVIGHEYFHNWSGNRVTCRDWFQLSLKEGFTVFRDQEFSADMGSRSVKRIDDVNILRNAQFREDAGPMSHPVRPDSYVEINNFYTMTVYNKGAEVVRMLHNILGDADFRKGTDLYFSRHDGEAVTTEEFVRALEDASGKDFTQFRLWYSQAGTPQVEIKQEYDATNKTYSLSMRQSCPDTPGQTGKKPFHIPVAVGLLGSDGRDLPLKLEGREENSQGTMVLDLKQEQQVFCFEQVEQKPVPSVLRGFSAPVKVSIDLDEDDLCFLMSNDSDGFNRWEASQKLYLGAILGLVDTRKKGGKMNVDARIALAVRGNLEDKAHDKALIAQSLTLPSEAYISEFMNVVDPDAIYHARRFLKEHIAQACSELLMDCYQAGPGHATTAIDQETMASRSLKNVCLSYLMELDDEDVMKSCLEQFDSAGNMTDTISAFTALVNKDCYQREQVIDDFYTKWMTDTLVIDKWFAIQATSRHPDTIDRVIKLVSHTAFSIRNPNKVRSLIGAFSHGNQYKFHDAGGKGYHFLGDRVIEIDAINPQIASRLVAAFTYWQRFDQDRQAMMKQQLSRIMETPGLSKDVYEIVSKSLAV